MSGAAVDHAVASLLALIALASLGIVVIKGRWDLFR